MNSLASILYSSSSGKSKKRKNLSLQPSIKPSSITTTKIYPKSLKYKANGMLFRSSTPKTPLTTIRTTATTTTAHPISTSSYFSTNSPQSPRCSTPVFSKQRRTRPFIACELCRQRAFESLNENKNEKKNISYHRSTTLCHSQNQMSTKIHRRQSSIEQLLVWIV